MALNDEIENVHRNFSEIFIGGIPRLLNNDGAYLSFICIFAGTEALAGYRYADLQGNGQRFRTFITDYFESRYHPLVNQLWDLRNSMIHSFSPKHFVLCHHQSNLHFTERPPYSKVLNAEDIYAAFVTAADKYFQSLKTDTNVQTQFQRRLNDQRGGSIYVS